MFTKGYPRAHICHLYLRNLFKQSVGCKPWEFQCLVGMPTESQNLVYIQLKSVEQNCLPGLWSVSKVLMLGRKRHHWPEPKVANSIREHLAEHCWKWESRRKVEGGWNQGWVIHCDGCMLLLIRVFPDNRWAASACLARPPSFFSSFKQFSIKSIQTHV